VSSGSGGRRSGSAVDRNRLLRLRIARDAGGAAAVLRALLYEDIRYPNEVRRPGVQGEAELAIGYGGEMKSCEEFDSQYAASAGNVTAMLGATPSMVRIPLFNPTWSGIAGWMKYGFGRSIPVGMISPMADRPRVRMVRRATDCF
jgi:hypothetical protein